MQILAKVLEDCGVLRRNSEKLFRVSYTPVARLAVAT